MPTVVVDTRAAVLKQIKDLPPLPGVIHELLAVLRRSGCSAEEVTRVLSADQAVAGRILRLVNSPFYGFSGEISTISRAVVILGNASLKSLATALSVAGSLGGILPAESSWRFWQHALVTAAAAEVIGQRTGLPDPEEAFIAGLLHDVGHLVLMLAVPAEYAAAADAGELGELKAEKARIGFEHCRAGCQLLEHWKLPSLLADAARLHHNHDACLSGDKPLLTVVALADRVAHVTSNNGESLRVYDDVLELARAAGLTVDDLIEMLPAISARAAAARGFLSATDLESMANDSSKDLPGQRVAVLGSDAARNHWLSHLLEFHGHALVNSDEYVQNPSAHEVDSIVFDAGGTSAERAASLSPVFAAAPTTIHVIGGELPAELSADLRAGCRQLPLVFSAGDFGL